MPYPHARRPFLPATIAVLAVMSAGLVFTARNAAIDRAPLGARDGIHHHAEQHVENPSGSAARPRTVVTPVSCEKLPDVPGRSVTTLHVAFPPDAYTGPHRHPGSLTAYVLTGTVRSRMAGGPAVTYPAGGTWFEPAMALHAFAENASATEPAELLATIVADDDCGPLVIPEK